MSRLSRLLISRTGFQRSEVLYHQAPVTSASIIGQFDSASAKKDPALGKAESHSTSSRIRFRVVLSRDFSSSVIKARPRRAEEKNVQDLLASSQSFLTAQDLPFKEWSRNNFQIFNQWHRALFKIPYNNQQLLERCAVCIDLLVHAFLDKYKIQNRAKKMKGRATQFVCTGIYAWGRLAEYDRQAPVKAEVMFQSLKKTYDDSQNSAFRPTEEVYSALAYSWSMASSHPQAPVRAHRWLNEILQDPLMNVRAPTYNVVLRAYARQGNIGQVQQLIAEMPMARDGYVYESLVRAWLNSDHPDAPQEAFKALQEGIQQGLEHKDIASLANLFLGFMNMNRDKPELCERALKQILILQQEYPSLEILDVRHLVTAMKSWADKGESEKVERLFELLHNEKGDAEFQPTYQMFVVVLSAFTKQRNFESLQHAELLLEKIETVFLERLPESISNHGYNLILDSYARMPDLGDRMPRIRALIERMENLADKLQNPSLLPDKFSYASLIQAIREENYAKPKDDFLDELESVVLTMEESDRSSMKPDLNTYALVLDAFTRSRDTSAPERAERILDGMTAKSGLHPDAIIFTILMKIYSNAGAVEKSDNALSRMVQDYKDGNLACQPSQLAYKTAMSSWARSNRPDAVDRAIRLFHGLMRQYEHGNSKCRPNEGTFLQLMTILSLGHEPSKHKIGQILLDHMMDLGIPPSKKLLNTFLHACSRTTGDHQDRQDALSAAMEIFWGMRKRRNGVESYTYNCMFHVCQHLIDDTEERERRLCQVFSQCANDGLVNQHILATLRKYLPLDRYESLISSSKVGCSE